MALNVVRAQSPRSRFLDRETNRRRTHRAEDRRASEEPRHRNYACFDTLRRYTERGPLRLATTLHFRDVIDLAVPVPLRHPVFAEIF
jgi:hypothetical protein